MVPWRLTKSLLRRRKITPTSYGHKSGTLLSPHSCFYVKNSVARETFCFFGMDIIKCCVFNTETLTQARVASVIRGISDMEIFKKKTIGLLEKCNGY